MGEAKRRRVLVSGATEGAVETPGGRMQVRWDEGGKATAMGQLVFFAEYLGVAGLFERWVSSCPLHYTSPNAPSTRYVLGSWMLSILDGQRRYAHLASLRADGLVPKVLGMGKIEGDDCLRRALAQIVPAAKARHSDAERAAQQAQVARATHRLEDQLVTLPSPWRPRHRRPQRSAPEPTSAASRIAASGFSG